MCLFYFDIDYVLSRSGVICWFFFFSSRRRHTRWTGDWSSDVCSSDLQELPLREARVTEGDVARNVLEEDPSPEDVLHRAHALRDVLERLLGVGQRQQVVSVASRHTGPAQMIGDPRRLHTPRELLHLLEVAAIERRAAADRHRYAVHRERITLAHAHQVMQRLAARHQIVFGEDLEPVDGGAIGKDRFVVIDPQAKTETERRGLQHGRRRGGPGGQRARPAQWLTSLWPSRRRTPPSSSPGTPCPCRSSGPCRRCWRSCTRSVPCRN